jgi:chemotaxis protein CheX
MTQLTQITLDEDEVREIVAAVTTAFVQLHAYVAPKPGDDEWAYIDESWTGCICVNGAYNGAITLSCTRAFAHHAARGMFGAEAGELSDEFARDALAELTNVVGGNIKSLLSQITASTCSLSLPTVSTGECTLPGARLVRECWCQCGDERIAVSVFEASASVTQVDLVTGR